jgi:hypothetical protein
MYKRTTHNKTTDETRQELDGIQRSIETFGVDHLSKLIREKLIELRVLNYRRMLTYVIDDKGHTNAQEAHTMT